jgi:ribonuclease HI
MGEPEYVEGVRLVTRVAEDFDWQRDGVIYVWTDGSCAPNPGNAGGWAYRMEFLKYIDEQRLRYETTSFGSRREPTTNNRMELIAVIEAMSAIKGTGRKVVIFSDSRYVVGGANRLFSFWKRAGWSKPKVNGDLWLQLFDLCVKQDVAFQWIRGHNGDWRNERVDRLAQTCRERLQDRAK